MTILSLSDISNKVKIETKTKPKLATTKQRKYRISLVRSF